MAKLKLKRSNSPSPAVLAALAALAAAAEGAPIAPASFLCPRFALADDDSDADEQDGPSHSLVKRRDNVPDRFEQGQDGKWHRVTYDTQACSSCENSPSSNTAIAPADSKDNSLDTDDLGVIDTAALVPNNTATSNTTYASTHLPPGWGPPPSSSGVYRESVIVLLSLALACLIAALIAGTLIWRRKKKDQAKLNAKLDLERTGEYDRHGGRRRKRGQRKKDDDECSEEEWGEKCRARQQQKVWARATARWKANARWVYRRARGKRISVLVPTSRWTGGEATAISSTATLATAPVPTEEQREQLQEEEVPPLPTLPQPSPPSSPPPPPPATPPPQPPLQATATTQPDVPPCPDHDGDDDDSTCATDVQPPAYGPLPSLPTQNVAGRVPGVISGDELNSGPARDVKRPPRDSDEECGHSDGDLPPRLTPPPLESRQQALAAHVATDDKRVLARLAGLASRPDGDDDEEIDSDVRDDAGDQQMRSEGEVREGEVEGQLRGRTARSVEGHDIRVGNRQTGLGERRRFPDVSVPEWREDDHLEDDWDGSEPGPSSGIRWSSSLSPLSCALPPASPSYASSSALTRDGVTSLHHHHALLPPTLLPPPPTHTPSLYSKAEEEIAAIGEEAAAYLEPSAPPFGCHVGDEELQVDPTAPPMFEFEGEASAPDLDLDLDEDELELGEQRMLRRVTVVAPVPLDAASSEFLRGFPSRHDLHVEDERPLDESDRQ